MASDEVAEAFRARNIRVLVGDWTRGDPAIGRFLERHGRSGVPLYLFYRAGRRRARGAAAAANGRAPDGARRLRRCRSQALRPADIGLQHPGLPDLALVGLGEDVAVDEDEIGIMAGLQRAEPVLGEAGISGAAGEGGEGLLHGQALLGQPAAGRLPFASSRLIAAARPGKGLGLSTGKSEPKASGTRLSSIARQA